MGKGEVRMGMLVVSPQNPPRISQHLRYFHGWDGLSALLPLTSGLT